MKKRILFVYILMMAALLAGCKSSASVPAALEKPSGQSGPCFEGDGGKGIRLAVLEPEGKGLTKEDQYLTSFVQGILTGDINRVTAMTIIDRQNLDKIISEQLTLASLTAEDAEDAIKIGKITNTQLVLTGQILKTRMGYSLQLAVTDVEKAERKASYNVNATAQAIEKSTAVKDAAADLLSQLGITLTGEGKEILYGVAAKTVEAETALSKGIAAQKSGTVVEALSYYYNAASFDPSLAEAAGRMNVLSGEISAGNIGQNIRSDLQRREAWLKVMKEAAAFFSAHPPYEIVYDPELSEGDVDYHAGTAELSFNMALHPTAALGVINTIIEGLAKTGKKDTWGFENWPFAGEGAVFSSSGQAPELDREFVDQHSGFVGRPQGGYPGLEAEREFSGFVGRPQGGYPGLEVEREFAALTGRPLGGYAGNGVLVTAALLNDRGETIATAQTAFSPIPEIMEGSRVWAASSIYPVTFIVKIDDISDTMTVKVVQINGKDPAAAGNAGYMQITAAGDDYKIGDKGPAGGIVFSRIGPAGKRYLEAAPADIPPAGWEEAMNLCARYKLNGYADWFMPDKSQLTMLYKMHLKGLGGFKDAVYWSSERADHPALRWYQNFYPGNQYGAPGSRQDIERRQDYRDSGGSYRYLTRPIRAF